MADISCKEILVPQDDENSKLRIVSWNGREPKLERRSFYTKDGEQKIGKASGLDLEDILTIVERKDEIMKAMGMLEPEKKKKGGSKGGKKKTKKGA